MIKINNSPRALALYKSMLKFEATTQTRCIRDGRKFYNILSNASSENRKLIMDAIFDVPNGTIFPLLLVGACYNDDRLEPIDSFTRTASLFTYLRSENVKRIFTDTSGEFHEECFDLIVNPVAPIEEQIEAIIIRSFDEFLPFNDLMRIIEDDREQYPGGSDVPDEPDIDDIELVLGQFIYSGNAPASGGTLSKSGTPKLLKNGVAQTVLFTYSGNNSSYGSVNPDNGMVTFYPSESTSVREITVTARCEFEGKQYSITAKAKQSAYVKPVDTYTLSGTISYNSPEGVGGTLRPNNSLELSKNGQKVNATFSYSSNQSWAVVSNDGTITLSKNTGNSNRNVTITVNAIYDGQVRATKTITITQPKYEAPKIYVYVLGAGKNVITGENISEATLISKEEISAGVEKSIMFSGYSRICLICPTDLNCTLLIQNTAIPVPLKDNEHDYLSKSSINYEGENMNLFQYKYGTGKITSPTEYKIKFE